MPYKPDQGKDRGITSFYVRRSVWLAFFGRPSPSQYNRVEETTPRYVIVQFQALIEANDRGPAYEVTHIAALREIIVDAVVSKSMPIRNLEENMISNLRRELDDVTQVDILAGEQLTAVREENSTLRESSDHLKASTEVNLVSDRCDRRSPSVWLIPEKQCSRALSMVPSRNPPRGPFITLAGGLRNLISSKRLRKVGISPEMLMKFLQISYHCRSAVTASKSTPSSDRFLKKPQVFARYAWGPQL